MNDTILFDSTADSIMPLTVFPMRDNFYYFERIPERDGSNLVGILSIVNFLLIVLVLWQVFRKKPTRG